MQLAAFLAAALFAAAQGMAPAEGLASGWLFIALAASFAASESRYWKPGAGD